MCDEARGCRLGTPKRVIFAEYVRFNRAIVTKTATIVLCGPLSRSLPREKRRVSKSGFPRGANETHGAVFGNPPHESKRSPKKSLHYYIGYHRMGEIL